MKSSLKGDRFLIFLQWFLVIVNITFCMAGVLVMVTGIYFCTRPILYHAVMEICPGSVFIIIAVGIIILAEGCIGCAAAMKKNTRLLYAFGFIVIFILISLTAAVILVYFHRNKISSFLVKKTLNKYVPGVNQTDQMEYVVDTIDFFQHKFKCCGVDAATDWSDIGREPPHSCYTPPNSTGSQRGCLQTIFKSYQYHIFTITGALGLTQLMAVISSFSLIWKVEREATMYAL